MDEQAWLTEQKNVWPLLRTATEECSERKLRLFACACARQVLPVIDGVDAEEIIEAAERVADRDPRQLEPGDWHDEYRRARDHRLRVRGAEEYAARVLEATVGINPRVNAVTALEYLIDFELESFNDLTEESHLAIIREVFGNPFRPIDFASWRTDTAVSLAKQMYASREFGAMSILADALQDAGCDNDDVLSHCRDPKLTHVRGCWVVDGVLGKE